jgi:hypothetical protein
MIKVECETVKSEKQLDFNKDGALGESAAINKDSEAYGLLRKAKEALNCGENAGRGVGTGGGRIGL